MKQIAYIYRVEWVRKSGTHIAYYKSKYFANKKAKKMRGISILIPLIDTPTVECDMSSEAKKVKRRNK